MIELPDVGLQAVPRAVCVPQGFSDTRQTVMNATPRYSRIGIADKHPAQTPVQDFHDSV